MALFIWKDSFNTNILEIDDQHKRIFGTLNHLHHAVEEGIGDSLLGEILDEMKDYVDVHFTSEEAILEKYDYPELVAQKHQHAFYVLRVAELIAGHREGREAVTQSTLQFLRDWLVVHILKEDKKFERYLAEKIKSGV